MAGAVKQCKGGTLHLVKIPNEYKQKVGRVAEKAFAEAAELFAYKKLMEVTIFPGIPEIIIPEIGIGAIITERGDIIISIDFSRHNIREIIKEDLPPIIYHEFSHVVRGAGEYQTLLESFILEGIACYVGKRVFKRKVLYIASIRNEMKYWRRAQKDFGKKKNFEERKEWFFGTKKFPKWIGYRLGYLIVSSFMKKNPEVSFAELVRMEAKNIFKDSSLA